MKNFLFIFGVFFLCLTFSYPTIACDEITSITVEAIASSTCSPNDGTIIINAEVADPTIEHTLEYSVDGGTTFLPDNVITGLAGGSYDIAVRYTDGDSQCVENSTQESISEFAPPTIQSVTTMDATDCQEDGNISIIATGDRSLQYSINGMNWQDGNTFSNLTGGTYQPQVRYKFNPRCPVLDDELTLTGDIAPIINDIVPFHPSGSGNNDGSITVNAAGGNGNLRYSIDEGGSWPSSNVFTGLGSGTYPVWVRNSDGSCLIDDGSVTLDDNVSCDVLELNSQTEVDNFALFHPNCIQVNGDLFIKTTDNNDPINDLSPLSNINYIDGNLDIRDNNQLSSLSDLQNLTFVKGDINIFGNDMIANLDGLQQLTTINSTLHINDNSNISSLFGLQNIQSIGEDLLIYNQNDPSFTTLTGLTNLQYIVGDLKISNNTNLESLIGLENLLEVGGLQIWEQNDNQFTNLVGLSSLQHIEGSFNIFDCISLLNFSGIENLQTIEGQLTIRNNVRLQRLEGLDNLQQAGGIKLQDNPQLTSITNLRGLKQINGVLSINNNDALYSLSGLENLTVITRDLHIVNNFDFCSLYPLRNLQSIGSEITSGDKVYIVNNPCLYYCAIEAICPIANSTNKTIENNSNLAFSDCDETSILEPCNCFPSGITFELQREIDAFPNLYPYCSEITGNVTINDDAFYASDEIKNLTGLSGVTSIGGFLTINSNPSLTSLAGLEQLNFLGGSLGIYSNPVLSECTLPPFCEVINDEERTVFINHNTGDCTKAQVENVCKLWNPILIECGFSYNNNTSNTNTTPMDEYCGSGGLGAPNIFHLLEGTGDLIIANLCNSDYDTRIDVYCTNSEEYIFGETTFNCVAGNDDDNCGFLLSSRSKVTFQTEIGKYYYIMVHGNDGESGGYELEIDCTTICTPPANNNSVISYDGCGFIQGIATALIVGQNGICHEVFGTTECATTGLVPSCYAGKSVEDIWYKFNSGDATNLNLTLLPAVNTSINAYAMTVYDANRNEVYCNSSAAVCQQQLTGLTTNADYYIQVWSKINEPIEFNICVYEDEGAGCKIGFTIPDITSIANETVSIPVLASNFEDIEGFYINLIVPSSVGTVVGVSNFGIPDLDESDFSSISNAMQLEWSHANGVNLDNGTTLFTIEVQLNNEVNLSGIVEVELEDEVIQSGQEVHHFSLAFINGTLETSSIVFIEGWIEDINGDPLTDVDVYASTFPTQNIPVINTGNTNTYYHTLESTSIPPHASTRIEKQDDATENVDILDILLIKAHLEGNISFGTGNENAWKYVAAKVTGGEGAISQNDADAIKDVLLGYEMNYPSFQNWLFYPHDYDFNGTYDLYPQRRDYNSINSSFSDQNYIGVKAGDLTQKETNFRRGTAQNIQLNMEDASVSPNAQVTIPVKAFNFTEVTGMEFKITWDDALLDFQSVQDFGITGLATTDFGTKDEPGVADNELWVLWDNYPSMETLSGDVTLFTITFQAADVNALTSIDFCATNCTKFYDNNLNQHNITTSSSQVTIGNPLPLELLQFSAQLTKQQEVQLTWQTATEKDLQHFDIQRSIDAVQWTKIGKTAAVGNSNRVQNYQFIDAQPHLGKSLYRLQSIHQDGSIAFSKVQAIVVKETDKIIYNNPVTNTLEVTMDIKNDKTIDLKLYNLEGRLVATLQRHLEKGIHQIQISVQHLVQGVYMLELENSQLTEVFKVVKM